MLDDPAIELVAIECADAERNLAYAQRCDQTRANSFISTNLPEPVLPVYANCWMTPRGGRVVQMGYQWRYHSGMQAAMEAARKGWLGRVYRFRASIDKPIRPKSAVILPSIAAA